MTELIKEIAQETTEQLSALQIFENEEIGSIRATEYEGSIMFCLTDVCRALGLSQPSKVKERLAEKGVNSIPTPTKGGKQNLLFINESNLYKTIFQSRKESAERFTDWVTSEVLPQIRKTGGYIPVKEEDTDLEIMAKAHQIMERTIEEKNKKIEEQQILLEEKDAKIEEQQERIEDLEETEKDWKTLMDTTGTFSINQLSQFINIGEYHLFEYLRKLKVLWKNENNDNVPYRQHLSSGKFAVVPAVAPNGVVHSQTRVYPEGIPYITKLLRKNGYLA